MAENQKPIRPEMTEQQRKSILVETVKTFGNQEWFRDAVVYNHYPSTGEPTLEFKVNYVPLFERKTVKDFVLRFNLTERFVVIDKDGKPVE
jgi:hypothetical protein